jgi:hypothetical protein
MDKKGSRNLIRDLANEVSHIAHLPIQQENISLWKSLNRLQMKRPMVLIYSFPWGESEGIAENLFVRSEGEPYQTIERYLRRLLFKWHTMRADMVVSPVYCTPVYLKKPGMRFFDDGEAGNCLLTCGNVHVIDNGNPTQALKYKALIQNEKDLKKILTPVIEIDQERTLREYEQSLEILDPILHVERSGVRNIAFNPIDELAKHWGITNLLLDMTDRPELIHRAMQQLVDAYIACLDQFEKLGLLSLNSDLGGVITQGMGESFIDELPQAGYTSEAVHATDLWGGAAAQILSCVSPAMHEEFALRYEQKFLSRFGLTAYGCCEPLHQKINMLRQIKNLRKISMSSWIDAREAARNIRGDYVFSYRPNPSFLAAQSFDLQPAKEELDRILSITSEYGCPLELVLRTIITYRRDPTRLSQWVDMAMNRVTSSAISLGHNFL